MIEKISLIIDYSLSYICSIGESESLSFEVSDSSEPDKWSYIDGVVLGEIKFTITGAPQSADEAFREAAFKLSYEEILGADRYWAIKETLQTASLTLEEGVESLKNQGEDFYKVSGGSYLSDAYFYWDANWFLTASNESHVNGEIVDKIAGAIGTQDNLSLWLAQQTIEALNFENPAELQPLQDELETIFASDSDLESKFGSLGAISFSNYASEGTLSSTKQSLVDGTAGEASTWLRVALFTTATSGGIQDLEAVYLERSGSQLIYDLYANQQVSKRSNISAIVGDLPDVDFSAEHTRIADVGQRSLHKSLRQS